MRTVRNCIAPVAHLSPRKARQAPSECADSWHGVCSSEDSDEIKGDAMNRKLVACIGAGALVAACSGSTQVQVAEVTADAACAGGEVTTYAALERYAPCSSIAGDLFIRGVSDLSPLEQVRSITGALWIQNTTALDSLSGLERLESVELLMLSNNQSLGDVSALSRLREAGSLIFARNPALHSLEGMAGLVELHHLTALNNGLTSLAGLENLLRVERVTISRNAELVDIGALNGVAETESIHIDHNPRLSAQFGLFENLKAGHPGIDFHDNARLSSGDVARFATLASDGVASK
jgi:hypothetical protein